MRRRLIFFTGKGGVGKTSLAWATAQACRDRGKHVAVVSWSPFDKSTLRAPDPSIDWIVIETLEAFREYALQLLKFDRIFDAVFDNHVFRTFIRAAPGVAETVAAGKLWDLYRHERYDLLIVDLPSSGHAVSFFQSPKGVHSLFRTGFVHRDSEHILEMFEADTTRVDLVTLPEELPVLECRQLKDQLENVMDFRFGFLHLNQCTPAFEMPAPDVVARQSDPVQRCLRHHETRLRADAEAAADASALGLPVVRVERLALDSRARVVAGIAAQVSDQ